MSSVCPTCETLQRKFYCKDCLRTHVHQFRNATQRAEEERDAQVEKAKRSLASIDQRRVLRASVARLEDSIIEARDWTKSIQKSTEDTRTRIIRMRENLRRRRANLSSAVEIRDDQKEAQKSTPGTFNDTEQIKAMKAALSEAHAALARSRRVLIRELVQVFDIAESQPPSAPSKFLSIGIPSAAAFGMGSVLGTLSRRTRPVPPISALSHSYHPASRTPSGGGLSAAQTIPAPYAISTLTLPSNPAELAKLPVEHIQAVVNYLVQFLRLLTFYLGVRLPFRIVWDGGTDSVGRPWILANRGDDEGGWAKYPAPQPLFPPPSPSASQSPSSSTVDPFQIPASVAMYEHPSSSTHSRLLPSFTTGLAMLNYNIAYLLFTQRLTIPLPLSSASPPDALRNLVSLCFSPQDTVGLYSHGALRPPYRLGPPTAPHTARNKEKSKERVPFGVEFSDMLKIMHATMGTSDGRVRKRPPGRHASGEDDWDLVEVEEGLEEDEAKSQSSRGHGHRIERAPK